MEGLSGRQSRKILRLVAGLQRLPYDARIGQQADKLWDRIEKTIEPGRSLSPSLLRYLSVAATILLLAGVGWWWQQSGASRTGEEAARVDSSIMGSDWEEAINNTPGTMRLLLSDGSVVILEKDSRLRYRREFNDTIRTSYLVGEAFFSVQKDARRPFMVYANGLVTKVLGTSFSIRARERDPDVTVSVKTGRVSVYSEKTTARKDPEAGGIILSPNQKAVYKIGRETLSKTLVENPLVLQNTPPVSFAFEAAPAGKVFETLERVYGIEVLFDEELFKDCSLTIDLTHEDLYQKLEVICKVLEASYKLVDAQVIIYGSGCS